MLDNLKPHKASFSFSHSPLGALSLVIDNPYHPTTVLDDWKKVLVSSIFKKGDSDSLANCRQFPVSVVIYSYCLFYGLLSGLGSLFIVFFD